MKPGAVFITVFISGIVVGLFSIISIGGGHGTNNIFYFTFPLAALIVKNSDNLISLMLIQTFLYAAGLSIFRLLDKVKQGVIIIITIHLILYSMVLIFIAK